jgi:CRISPR-associated RAMP protein (TIGR02581 family)
MLKKLINECRLTLTLETKGPFIIKDGRYEKKKDEKIKDKKQDKESKDSPADSIPIFRGDITDNIKKSLKSATEAVESECFIPGTSLRGVIRSYAEKIARTVSDENDSICCDPFDTDIETPSPKASCSKYLDKYPPKNDKKPYSKSCVICKLFGCTATASRIQIHDSKTIKTGCAVTRDGIGIDRFTGGNSSGAKFINLVLEGYTFTNEITIRNFELWQLGLLAYVLRDLENELIPLGSGKSKGFGRVKGTVSDIKLAYYKDKSNKLKGIGELCSDEVYGFISVPVDIDLTPLSEPEWDYRKIFTVESNDEIANSPFWRACAKAWNDSIPMFKTISQLRQGDNQNG